MQKFRILLLCLPFILYAKPVSVDEIFTPKHQFKILGSFSYINLQRKNFSLSPIPFQMPDGSYISIPFAGYENINQDYLNFSLNARYGISKRVELFSTLNAFWQNSYAENNGIFSQQSHGDFGSLNFGFLVEAKKEGKLPALLVGGSADIVDQTYFSATKKHLQYAKGYSLFATTFYTVDPIVFLLQGSFRLNLPKRFEEAKINDADIFSLSPMVYFAVNPYVSLNAGVRYQYQTKDRLNDVVVGSAGSSVGYMFGMAYEIKTKLIFFADIERLDTHTYSSNAINLTLSYRI
ncbi:hypothetical protein LS68_006470 [Helicobacter sp. MIT 05-5293]|uniref:outer membrane beta-barrel protein n=1 Tax=Helicobacter sp. MIT 05-5293 TaxID=1548149 RepID=UPI00051DE937|nr:outer membrane beta-barrel protein [Helicobacter sp. MIT 05-5293]TLD80400.1 hypothetical protein LS68_006470 [Helicobacter sp. MIT 05-5293]